MQMRTICLAIALAVLLILTVVQILGACGCPVGRLIWGGKARRLPPRLRIASIGAVALYVGFAYVLLAQADAFAHDATLFTVLAWVLFGYLVLATLGNLASKSPAERATMAPASAILAAATLILTLT